MKLLKSLVLIVSFLIILPGLSTRAVLAQGGPPLITDDPGTPGDGKWEINVAFEAEKRGTQRSYAIPLLDINYGLGDRIQLKYEKFPGLSWTNAASTPGRDSATRLSA